MPSLIQSAIARLPLSFRVLFRQFLLRVIDLEALSIQADVERFLGQFAGVLIMVSLVSAAGAFISTIAPPATEAGWLAMAWRTEQFSITTMMLVVGLLTVISWDATFPDRRDVIVLAPLPVAPRTILFAKVSASSALVGLAILTLNGASSFAWSLILGMRLGVLGFLQFFAAWWFTMIAASVFLYCSVLIVQGFSALLFPRRVFLRLTAVLQLAAFGLFLAVYFVQPTIQAPTGAAAPQVQSWLAWSPSFWFLALFNQLNGSLPVALSWLAVRAWVGLSIVVCGATASLLLCYMRTMKKTVEEPDLVPGSSGLHWTPSFGSELQSAIVLFSIRSLTRSRQHRVAFALFLAIVLAIALAILRGELPAFAPALLSPDFLISTIMMMIFATMGLRSVISLPISLTANWVLRTTQLCQSYKYVAATKRSMLVLAVAPVWIISALLAIPLRPYSQVAGHLTVLALAGYILAELNLIGFYKVPFTCSYLPGKSNIQFVFWGSLVAVVAIVIPLIVQEWHALQDGWHLTCMLALLAGIAFVLWAVNRHRAKSAVIYFEELPDEGILTLGLRRD